ncbi:hypothetical protein CR513_34949, partial [Mucuna pruriens]
MTRSNANMLYDFDPEIELTLRRLRKVRNTIVSTNNSLNTSFTFENRANGELGPNVEGASHTRCGVPTLLKPAQSYELKSRLIHLLPKFHGLAGEDPHKHLKEFHVVCSTMRPQGIREDYIKMKAFPFPLDGAAKDWLYL